MSGRAPPGKSPVPALRRWKCVCAYDGTTFAGWQSQAGGTAIQDVIEARLAQIFKRPVRIHGSGRTDAGVHAHGQVFHFDAAWTHGADKLLFALRVLSPAIQVKSVRAVPMTFHARFEAKGKRYEYRVHLGDADPFTRPWCWSVFGKLDFEAMEEVAAVPKLVHGPCLLNMVFRGKTPLAPVADVQAMGYRMAIMPSLLFRSVLGMCEAVLGELRQTGVHPELKTNFSVSEGFRRMGGDFWDPLRTKFRVPQEAPLQPAAPTKAAAE